METFDFSGDASKAIAALSQLEDKMGYVAMNTMNDIGFSIRRENADRMDSLFEGGVTSFTKNAVVVDRATRDNLAMTIRHHPVQGNYLQFQEEGGVDDRTRPAGVRTPKLLARPIGNKVPLDARGNIPATYVDEMLSNKSEFFIGRPRGERWSGTHFGLWRRVGRGEGRTRGFADLSLYVMFKETREYTKKVYGFKDFVRKKFRKDLRASFGRALKHEIDRLMR